MANTVAAGAIFRLLGYDVEDLCTYLETTFKKKGAEVIEKNKKCARAGAELVASRAASIKAPKPADAPKTVYNGMEAVGLAAATGGVKFIAAYPMTPSTGVFTYLAGAADEYGIVAEQAEDEIAAVNMICGATYAGVPAMATTSGGGFALMVEGLALAGMMELPIFIYLGQRPGPATGLPTRTAQQDLKFAINAGHGEFPRAIFAPGTVEQAYALTRRALETAHKFQTPAILMYDQFLADVRKNIPPLDATPRPIDRRIVEKPPPDYVRYAVTPDGISPRAIPGTNSFVICDSDEHTENGHITEDLLARVRLQDKRMAKEKGMLEEFLPPELYGPKSAAHLLIAWGSTYGPCREAVDILNAKKKSVAMLHFAQVWPINAEKARRIIAAGKRKKITSVEGNSTGLFASVLRERGVLEKCELMLRYDGLPFTGEEISRRIKQ
jgi:2-oxoglutarate ferredoxin oxidoreductase subunit alpha